MISEWDSVVVPGTVPHVLVLLTDGKESACIESALWHTHVPRV